MADSARKGSIKALVYDYVNETGGDVDYDELTRRVMREFPDSAWKKTHWSYYKTQIANGRYKADFPEAIRLKLNRGRPVDQVRDPDSTPSERATAGEKKQKGERKATVPRPRKYKDISALVFPNLLDDAAHLGIALTLANVAHHVHPNVVHRIQELNAAEAEEWRSILPSEIDAEEYLYPGSACVFPGVHRAVGTFGKQQKAEINKYNPRNRAIIDQNRFPRPLWTYLTSGKGFGGPVWKESGLEQFELAHIFGHKPDERSLEAEVFENFESSVRPWGLFTCASNVVLLPKGLAKPTDQLKALRLVFFKRAIELYGEDHLPGASGLRDDAIPSWYSDLEWNEPLLPEDWEVKVDRLNEYRKKRLKKIFGMPL